MKPAPRLLLAFAAALGLLAVAAGTMAAHVLEDRLAPGRLEIFELAARYQMYHALALLGAAWACDRLPGRLVVAAGLLLAAGTLVFSGSLYALALSGVRWWGAVTPFGGVAFLVGWALLLVAALRGR